MLNEFSRMEILVGEEGVEKLAKVKVAVFGLGGVGSYVVENLARCGIGGLILVDHDTVSITNINRQIFALHSTVGRAKVQVAQERVKDISPDILVRTYETFYNEDTADMFHLEEYDYIVDAIDTALSKLLLIERAQAAGVPVISCLGIGNKFDPSRLEITDISRTGVCPLARMMRTELRKRGIRKLKVLHSREKPVCPEYLPQDAEQKREHEVSGSISFVPGTAGMYVASEVVRDLLGMSRR